MRERIDVELSSGKVLSVEVQTASIDTHDFFRYYQAAWHAVLMALRGELEAIDTLAKGDGTGEP